MVYTKTEIANVSKVKFRDNLTKKDISGLMSFLKNYNEKVNFGVIINKNIQKKDGKLNYISPFLIETIIS